MLSSLRKKLSLRRLETRSLSQCREDRIAAFILDALRTVQPTYLDLGAHDPCQRNNTFQFYLRGGRGVLPTTISDSNDLLCRDFAGGGPDFVSLDIEGMDLEIRQAWDFRLSRPAVFCIETLTNDADKQGRKRAEMTPLLESLGDWLYADTYINSLDVDGQRWEARRAAA